MSLRVLLFLENELDSNYNGRVEYIRKFSIIGGGTFNNLHIINASKFRFNREEIDEWASKNRHNLKNPLWWVQSEHKAYVIHPEDSEKCRNLFTQDPEEKIDRLVGSISELLEEIRYNPKLGALSTLPFKEHFNSTQ